MSQQNYKSKFSHAWQKFSFILAFLLSFVSLVSQGQEQNFVVVLDPGHGGKDSGALGKKIHEKELVLDVALKVGEILKEKHKDIKVVYTRDSDVFIELHKRGSIANKANADLFVSIHANSASPAARGTETFVLGVHRNKTNLNIAKKENDVILLENNYEKHYNYNPKNPESIIGLTLMQEEFLDQSIRIAKLLENYYSDTKKNHSRGVKQAGLIVLHQTYMPSILTEIGFISNKKEEDFLRSKKGQKSVAQAIVNAIVEYKNELDQSKAIVDSENHKDDSNIYEGIEFKVQIATGSNKIETKSYNFKGLQPIYREQVGKFYKYYYGKTSNYNAAQQLKEEAHNKGFKDAFIVAYKNQKRVSIKEILKSH